MIRLKLKLKTAPYSILPFNYEEQVSRWIEDQLIDLKRIIDTRMGIDNPERIAAHLAADLCLDHFTFTKILLSKPFSVQGSEGMRLDSGEARLTINCYCGEGHDQAKLAMDVMRGSLMRIQGRRHTIDFRVVDVVQLDPPVFTQVMRFKTQTPIFMSTREANSPHPVHVSPTSVLNYGELLKKQLLNQARDVGLTLESKTVVFKCTSTPKSKMLHFGNWKYRAFHFEFLLCAPVELMELAYYSGFGMLSRELGLGMCGIIPDEAEEQSKIYGLTELSLSE